MRRLSALITEITDATEFLLMINGRCDHHCPVEVQRVMFLLPGTPETDKRHAFYEAGHAIPQNLVIKETLNWFDRYLGPVLQKPLAANRDARDFRFSGAADANQGERSLPTGRASFLPRKTSHRHVKMIRIR